MYISTTNDDISSNKYPNVYVSAQGLCKLLINLNHNHYSLYVLSILNEDINFELSLTIIVLPNKTINLNNLKYNFQNWFFN